MNLLIRKSETGTKPRQKETVSGPKAKYWFWGADQVSNSKPSPAATPPAPKTGYEQALKILNDNPEISAATFMNMLKVAGLEIGDSKESNVASSQPLGVFADDKKKESSKVKAKGNISFRCKLTESLAMNDGIGPTKFRSILIQEGLGNLETNYFYTRQALESAVPVFEGKKFFADHPSSIEEASRPERSVRDVIGYFEGIKIEDDEDGRAMLTGDLVLMPDKPFEWARALIRESINYSKKFPDKDLVGLSINASGDAEEVSLEEYMKANPIHESVKTKVMEAQALGIETIKVVKEIQSAVSCDLVTEAGAGGRISQMIEANEGTMSKKIKENDKKEEEAKAAAAEAAPADDAKAAGHDDAEADAELIKKMLKQYLGEGEHDEATHALAKEAYGAAKEMGMEAEEAMKCAGYAMKMAHHQADKKAKEAAPKKDDGDEVADKGEEKPEAKKESAQLIRLTAENAKLRESVKTFELDKFLDKSLKESGMPMQATKKFRECLGVAKSEKDITEKLGLFKEAYGMGGKALSGESFLMDSVETEKKFESVIGLDFSDCSVF